MNSTQKSILAIGVVALLATTFFAPYRWEGYNQFRYAMTGDREMMEGSANAPLWASPYAPSDTASHVAFTSVQLDAGKLAIWWGGIALLTAAAVALSAPRRNV